MRLESGRPAASRDGPRALARLLMPRGGQAPEFGRNPHLKSISEKRRYPHNLAIHEHFRS